MARWTCPVCDDAFDEEAAVRDHAWHAHGACHHCGGTFDDREALQAHWLDAHEGDLSRIDRRKAREAADDLSTTRTLRSLGPRAALERADPRLLAIGVGVLLVAAGLVWAGPGLGLGGGNAGPTAGGDGSGLAGATSAPTPSATAPSGNGDAGGGGGVPTPSDGAIGTPDATPGPYNDASRQSTATIGQPGAVHWHATLEVVIYGRQIDFARPVYMFRSKYVHFENGDGRRVHKHVRGVTLTDVFFMLDWRLTDRCLTTPAGTQYCTGPDGTLHIVVNGEEIDDPQGYRIRDGDTIRVVYEK